MAQHYTLNTFLRQTPNNLLARYFRRRSLPKAVAFNRLKKTECEPIIQAMESLPDDQRSKIENDFQDIFTLANPSGTQIMQDISRYHGLKIADKLEAMENHYHRAMWLFLYQNDGPDYLFQVCTRLAHIKDLPFSKAKQRKNLPKRKPRFDRVTLRRMAKALREFYSSQGRGHKCIVEHYVRPDPIRHCYFAFPEDYSTSDLEYSRNALVPRNRKSVMEIGFIYRPDEGTLEIGAYGKKAEIQELQHIFCQVALRMNELPPVRNDQVYKLNRLMRRHFDFPTDPEDRIESVKIVSLRLDYTASKYGRITIEQSPESRKSLYDWIRRVLDVEKIPLRMWDVTQAKIMVAWRRELRRRQKTLTFTLTTPDSSTLKDLPGHQVIKRYLKKWQLM